MIRLLAFDLDGTTITQHKHLSPRNKEALLSAAERGVILVPATGRMRDFLPAEIVSLPGVRYAVTSNGAAVYDLKTGKTVYCSLIPNEKAKEVQRLLDGCDVYLEYYREGRAITKSGYPERAFSHFGMPETKRHFVEDKDYTLVEDFGGMLEETGLCPEKINLPCLTPETRAWLWEKLDALGGLRITSSIPDNLEINAASADKGSAVLALAEMLGVAREEILAVGDNGNDVPMLLAAGCSAAVGDGSPEALAAAKYTVAAHDQDGLAEAVERFL